MLERTLRQFFKQKITTEFRGGKLSSMDESCSLERERTDLHCIKDKKSNYTKTVKDKATVK